MTADPCDIERILPVLRHYLLHKQPMLELIAYEGTPQQQQRLRERIEAFPLDVCVGFGLSQIFENLPTIRTGKCLRVYEDSDGAVTIEPLGEGTLVCELRTRAEGLLLSGVEPELLYRGVLYRIHENHEAPRSS